MASPAVVRTTGERESAICAVCRQGEAISTLGNGRGAGGHLVNGAEFPRSMNTVGIRRLRRRDKWPCRFLPFRTLYPSLPLHPPLFAGAQVAFSFILLLRCCRPWWSSGQLEQASHTPPPQDDPDCLKLPPLSLHLLFAYLRLLPCIPVSLFAHIDCVPKTGGDTVDIPRDRHDHSKDHYVRLMFVWLTRRSPLCSL